MENYYICLFISNTIFLTGLFNCDNEECESKFTYHEIMSKYIDVLLYDTLEPNLKIFCSKSEGSNNILLQKLIIERNANNGYTFSNNKLTLSTQYDSNSCDIKYCKFIEFLTEYLFCCSCTDYIKCTRFTLDFIEVNHFILNIEGENSFLSIINNVNYFSILFLNGNSLYKKNIYQTYCGDTNKDIYEEIEININRLVGLKIDSNYFLMFDGFDPEILMIKYNEEIIQINQTINLIYESNSDEVNFKFILKNDNILDNSVLNVFYTISNEGNYFATCSINLKIKRDSSTRKIIETSEIDNSIALGDSDVDDSVICFENCLSCEGNVELENGNIINQNCMICKEGFHFLFQTKNCYNNSIMEKGYYISSLDSMYHKCDIDCKLCIEDDSTNQQKCISCNIGTYIFALNNSCLNSCPTNYKINNAQNECIPENLEQKISLSELKEQISKNFSSFINSTNVINGTDFIAMIYSVDDIDPREQIKQGISAIDLGNCTNIIKEYYNISKEESFIVLNLESKKNQTEETNNDDFFDLGKNNILELYDFSGNKLNLSVCHENIKIMKYIGDVEELDIQSAMDLSNQGIDVFNAKDKFFNDLCYYYDNKERKDIFQNATFCQDGCFYEGMNYDLLAANCICDTNAIQNEELNNIKTEEKNHIEKVNFDSITKSFISSLFDFNFNVMKCINLIINFEILKQNLGFYSMIVMFLFQIIFLMIYLIKGIKSIQDYMILFRSKNKKSNSIKEKHIKNNLDFDDKMQKCNINKNNITKYKKKSILQNKKYINKILINKWMI